MRKFRLNRSGVDRPGRSRAGGRWRRALTAVAASSLSLAGVGTVTAAGSASGAETTSEHVIVSFTFDDARATQYGALSVFGTYDMHATFYVNTGWMGMRPSPDGYNTMTWAQLHDLADAGHEIGGHTVHHTALTDVDEATARAEIQGDITNLQAQGFPRPVSFAYPVGFYDDAVKSYVREAGYTSARTIDVFTREPNPPADPYEVRIIRNPYDGSDPLSSLQKDVTTAEAAPGKTWLIYVMHDFYSPINEGIDEFLAWLQPRAASGTVVKTVGEVMQPTGGANQPPVADAGPAQTVAGGSTVQLDGSGSSDADGDPLTYRWTQTGGTPVTLSSSTAARPTFTAPAGPTDLTFELVVSDGQVSSTPDTVTVTVTGSTSTNQPPVADAGPAQTVAGGSTVQLDGSGSSDADGDPLTYRWTQTGGSPVTLSSSTAASPTFTAPARPANLTFELVVSDGKVSSTPDTVTVKVVKRIKGQSAGRLRR